MSYMGGGMAKNYRHVESGVTQELHMTCKKTGIQINKNENMRSNF